MTGHPVRAVNAPRLNFQVSAEQIAKATRKDSSHCMIAEALRDAMPSAEYVSVDLATIRFTDTLAGRRYIYLTPGPAQMALIDFDQGDKVSPFSVKASAVQMVHTGAARKAKAIKAAEDGDELTPERATLAAPKSSSGSSVGVKVGGKTPPMGASSAGAGTGRVKRGRIRAFGLRAFNR
jgi:hypothetical protein